MPRARAADLLLMPWPTSVRISASRESQQRWRIVVGAAEAVAAGVARGAHDQARGDGVQGSVELGRGDGARQYPCGLIPERRYVGQTDAGRVGLVGWFGVAGEVAKHYVRGLGHQDMAGGLQHGGKPLPAHRIISAQQDPEALAHATVRAGARHPPIIVASGPAIMPWRGGRRW